MKYCAKCGAQLGENDKFCPQCGAPATNETPSAGMAGQPGSDHSEKPGKKKPNKLLVIVLAVLILAVIAVVAVRTFNKNASDQKVVFEGIEFSVPGKWTYSQQDSTADNLVFYTDKKGNNGKMLCFTAVPDINDLAQLFGTDSIDQLIDLYSEELKESGDAVTVEKMTVAGYDTYLFDVNGTYEDLPVSHEETVTVSGSYLMSFIINPDNSEMIIVYAAGLSTEDTDAKVLPDVRYVLQHAVKTSAANTY